MLKFSVAIIVNNIAIFFSIAISIEILLFFSTACGIAILFGPNLCNTQLQYCLLDRYSHNGTFLNNSVH